jgi:hypothetical protein
MCEVDLSIAQKHSHPLSKDKELIEHFMGGGAVTLHNGFAIGITFKCNVGDG